MQIEFLRTAPGIHMATVKHPRTGLYCNVAIIESMDLWNVYLDGDLFAENLASYQEAERQAQRVFSASGKGRMVRAAGLLVAFSLVGAATVVGAKMLPTDYLSQLSAAGETSQPTEKPASGGDKAKESTAPKTKIRPVILNRKPKPAPEALPAAKPAPVVTKVAKATASSPAVAEERASPADAAKEAPGTTVVRSSPVISEKEVAEVEVEVIEPPKREAQAVLPPKRRFSAENPVFASKPVSASKSEETAVGPVVEAKKVPDPFGAARREPAEEPKQSPVKTVTKTPEAPVEPAPVSVASEPAPEQKPEQKRVAVAELPPLPEKAQRAFAAATPEASGVEVDKDYELPSAFTAAIGRIAPEADREKPKARPRLIRRHKRKADRRRAAAHERASRRRRKIKKAWRELHDKERRARRHRRVVRRVRPAPRRHMSCFGGRCRWVYTGGYGRHY